MLCLCGLTALATAGYVVLWMMAHESSHTMRVTSVEGDRICGLDLDGSGQPQGRRFCITPDFPNTHEVASHLAPGDCVLVTTGEGGPRLEHEKACGSATP